MQFCDYFDSLKGETSVFLKKTILVDMWFYIFSGRIRVIVLLMSIHLSIHTFLLVCLPLQGRETYCFPLQVCLSVHSAKISHIRVFYEIVVIETLIKTAFESYPK